MRKKKAMALLFYMICVILSFIGMFLLDSFGKNMLCLLCLIYSFVMIEEILGL